MVWIGRASALFDLVWNVMRDDSLHLKSPESTFVNFFCDLFKATFGIESAAKKVHDGFKKRTFLIVNLFLHFNRWTHGVYLRNDVLFILL